MPETSDPTFYHSPAAAIAAPPESLADVAAFDPAGEQRDAMAVVDCDHDSPGYETSSPYLYIPVGLATDAEDDLYVVELLSSTVQKYTEVLPDTTIVSGPKGVTKDDRAQFSFSSNHPNSTFECSHNETPFSPCSTPQTYLNLADGSHSFRVRATDGDGSTDSAPATRNFESTPSSKASPSPRRNRPSAATRSRSGSE